VYYNAYKHERADLCRSGFCPPAQRACAREPRRGARAGADSQAEQDRHLAARDVSPAEDWNARMLSGVQSCSASQNTDRVCFCKL